MKSSSLLLLVLALSAVALAVRADDDPCTEQTCPQGIVVMQSFSESGDCTGNSTIRPEHNITEGCTLDDESDDNVTRSSQFFCSNGYYGLKAYSGVSCVDSAFAQSQGIRTGFCQRTGLSTSEVIWCSFAEARTSTPKAAPSYVNSTNMISANTTCDSSTGCTAGVATMFTFGEEGCPAESKLGATTAAYFLSDSLLVDDVCYVTNRSSNRYDDRINVQATCGTNTFSFGAAYGCGDSATPINSYVLATNKCIQATANQWVYITCEHKAAAGIISFSPVLLMAVALLIAFIL